MGRRRRFTGLTARLVRIFTLGFALYFILYLSGILHWLGIYVYDTSHTALFLTFSLVFAFLNIPAHQNAPKDRLPWYDLFLIILSLVSTLYIVINAERIAVKEVVANELHQILTILTVVLVLEASRRAVSPILTVIGAFFFLYPMFADYAPGFMQVPSWSLQRVATVQYLTPNGFFGSTMHIIATVAAGFIIFGSFLTSSGAGQAFINLALSVAGRYRGGPAKVAVLGSMLFGSVNGSPLANIATVGTVTIPLMKSVGYKPAFAGAIEAVASNGGPMTPPVMGAAIFVMMDFLGETYVKMMLISLVPVVLYYFGLFVMVDHEAVKNQLLGLRPEQVPPLKRSLGDSWFCMTPFAVIVYLLVFLHYSPGTASMGAVGSLVLVSMVKKTSRMGPRKLADALAGCNQGIAEIGSAVAIAGLLMGSFNITGIGLTMTQELVTLARGNLTVLIVITGIACLILGMGISGIAVYLMGAIFLAPALTQMGVKPLAAHYFVYWLAHAALITPPVCAGAFLAGTIAGAPLMTTGWQACRLGIVVYLMAVIWVEDPAILLVGSPSHVATAIVTAIVGVYFVSCGVAGRMLRPASWLERTLFIVGGVLLMIPGRYGDFTGFWYNNLIGLALVALSVLWQVRKARLPVHAPAS